MKPRFYLKGCLRPISPFAVGSGRSDFTDYDILLDENGDPFLPGTSLAGVCLHFLKKNGRETDELFGFVAGHNDTRKERQSRIRFFDAFLNGSWNRGFRNGVRIGEEGVAEDTGKFDCEVADLTGNPESYFDFRLSIDNVSDDDKEIVCALIDGFRRGEIRIGYKTSRGFGRFDLTGVRAFTAGTPQELLSFEWENMELCEPVPRETAPKRFTESRTYDVASFLSISDSSTLTVRTDDPDGKLIASEPLKNSSRAPVIPGSSWAGIFRHHFGRILRECGWGTAGETAALLDRLFGSTENASRILFEESVVSVGCCMQRTRNAVDRFTGGAGDKKLFTDEVCVGGTLMLTVILKETEEETQKLAKNLIRLTMDDLESGALAVGHSGSVGGGILRKAGKEHE